VVECQQSVQQTYLQRLFDCCVFATACRFDLQVVPNAAAKPKHGVDLLPAPKKGDQQQGKVRCCAVWRCVKRTQHSMQSLLATAAAVQHSWCYMHQLYEANR
jgi:hypothetical protein